VKSASAKTGVGGDGPQKKKPRVRFQLLIMRLADHVHDPPSPSNEKTLLSFRVLLTALKEPPMIGLKEPLGSGLFKGLGGSSN